MNPYYQPPEDLLIDAAEWLGCEPEEVTTDDLIAFDEQCRMDWAERE